MRKVRELSEVPPMGQIDNGSAASDGPAGQAYVGVMR